MFDELADLRRLSSGSILIWLIIGSYVEFLNFYINTHRRFRGIECRVLKICDFKKVILSLFFKHNIAGLGVLIPKRYHMLG